MTKAMITYYYEFEDGYFCWTVGRMDRAEKAWESQKHGKLLIERRA